MTEFDVETDALEVRFSYGLDLLDLYAEALETDRAARENALCAIQMYLRCVDRELRAAVDRRFREAKGGGHRET